MDVFALLERLAELNLVPRLSDGVLRCDLPDPDLEPIFETHAPALSRALAPSPSWAADLAEAGYNPGQLPAHAPAFDLSTTAWEALDAPWIHEHQAALHKQATRRVDTAALIRKLTRKQRALTLPSRLLAEAAVAAALPRERPVVLTNVLAPETVFQLIEGGLNPTCTPPPADATPFLGNTLVDTTPTDEVGALWLALCPPGSGGLPTGLDHLEQLAVLARRRGWTLILDATFLLSNSLACAAHGQGRDLWEVAARTCALADVVYAGLSCDFAATGGALLAVDDGPLFGPLRDAASGRGPLTGLAEQRLGLALDDTAACAKQVRARRETARWLWQRLAEEGLPVGQTPPEYRITLDLAGLNGFDATNPAAGKHAFLVNLFLETGIRAGTVQPGQLRDPALQTRLALDLPLGFGLAEAEQVALRLLLLFRRGPAWPKLTMVAPEPGLFGRPFARYALRERGEPVPVNLSLGEPWAPNENPEDIAVIGMAGRYPQSPDLETFWRNLVSGKVSLEGRPPQRRADYPDPVLPWSYPEVGGFLERVDTFDARFFAISPRNARLADPQERLFLETAWHCMEDAGHTPESLPRNTAVYVGAVWTFYQVLGHHQVQRGESRGGNSFLWSIANRLSFQLDLHGPSLTVDTACSASLTALHLAREALLRGDCQAAFVGGVNLDLHPIKRRIAETLKMVSPSGTITPFGKGNDGSIAGEGVGVLLLKKRSQAEAHGNRIHALIKTSAVNNSGHTAGYMVPVSKHQAQLMEDGLTQAGIDPRSIAVMEGHGTGTQLGDPVETASYATVFAQRPPGSGRLGSVKGNIGHLEAAAGIAGLTKMILQLRHQTIAPTPGALPANPFIEMEKAPFLPLGEAEAWSREGSQPRRGGVVGFGAGGSNGFAVLEEYPQPEDPPSAETEILVFSARDEARLRELVQQIHGFATRNPLNLRRLAFTLQVGRTQHGTRMALLAGSIGEMQELLARWLAGETPPGLFFQALSKRERIAAREHARNQVQQSSPAAERARDWVAGCYHEGTNLAPDLPGSIISLPGYPFAPDRFWLDHTDEEPAEPADHKIAPQPLCAAPEEGNREAMERLASERIMTIVGEVLEIALDQVQDDEDLSDYGIDSIGLEELAEGINRCFSTKVQPTMLYRYTDVQSLVTAMFEKWPDAMGAALAEDITATIPVATTAPTVPAAKPPPAAASPVRPALQGGGLRFPVAVIGMSGRLPGSDNLEQWWADLCAGKTLVAEIPGERWDWRHYHGDGALGDTTPIHWGAFTEGADCFDSLFFGISPLEAESMDPQQRVFLETAWHTFENAGYTLEQLSGSRTGVFVGVGTADYRDMAMASGRPLSPLATTGFSHAVLANRVSWFFDLQGPSEPVDTACSSALLAVARAMESLHSGGCDMALAGGVNLLFSPLAYVAMGTTGLLSSDGCCRPFDQAANGYVRGEGSLAVLLKPLAAARRDGDYIHGVLRGYAVNHNGKAANLTAPNPAAQVALLTQAWAMADVDPATITYVEAAANGTPWGDPMEFDSVREAFVHRFAALGKELPPSPFCLMGNSKAAMGHLETASGVASMVKVLLSMKHGHLPANIHLQQPNELLDLEGPCLSLLSEATPWDRLRDAQDRQLPRRAGVSSFGFSGVNVHVVLEEYLGAPGIEPGSEGPDLFVLSARNEGRLQALALRFAHWLTENPPALATLCYNSRYRRQPMAERLALVVGDHADLADQLTRFAKGEKTPKSRRGNTREKGRFSLLNRGEAGRRYLAQLKANRDLVSLAELWTTGFPIAWQNFYQGPAAPPQIPMPSYPMARVRHWFDNSPTPKPAAQATATTPADQAQEASVPTVLRHMIAGFLKMPAEEIEGDAPFASYGFDSFSGARLAMDLESQLGLKLPMSAMFHCRTLDELCTLLSGEYGITTLKPRQATAVTLPPEPESFPLSESQRALYFLTQLKPKAPWWNLPMTLLLKGELDESLIHQALELLARRHQSMRLRFKLKDGRVEHWCDPKARLPFVREDALHLDVDAFARKLRELAYRPFSLDQGGLFKCFLFKRPEGFVLLLLTHHLVADGVSFVTVLNELRTCYAALAAGETPTLTAPRARYADFVDHEQSFLADERGRELARWWRGQLGGELTDLDLPQDHHHEELSVAVATTTCPQQAVAALAARFGASPFMVMLTAFKILLMRYSGQQDFVVGTPFANRNEARFLDVVGYFTNILPLRDRMDGGQPLSQLLGQVKETTLAALDHGAYPFARMVADLGVDYQNALPLVQVVFTFQNMFSELEGDLFSGAATGRALEFQYVDIVHEQGSYDLSLEVVAQDDRYTCFLKYNESKFSRARMIRLGGHLAALIDALAADPEKPVAYLSYLEEGERRHLLETFNPAEAEAAGSETVHAWIERNAARRPDAPALFFEDQTLTYQALNERANQVARRLIRLGVGPESGVALCLERSLELAVGMLGILKAGAYYVPIDPAYPEERRALLLEDSGTPLVLTLARHQDLLRNQRYLCLDQQWGLFAREGRHNPEVAMFPENTAYVIYTSGSTGRPKGVPISHAALVCYCHSFGRAYAMTEADRTLQNASISFDISVEEIFSAWTHGCALVIPPPALILEPAALTALVAQYGVTMLSPPTAYWHYWVREMAGGGAKPPPCLRVVNAGGEQVSHEHLARWLEMVGERPLWTNAYGPTETTIAASHYEVSAP